jgi:hypothetical protein
MCSHHIYIYIYIYIYIKTLPGADDGPPDSGGSSLTTGGQPVAGSSIKQQISNRYNDILEQYVHELESIKQLFAANKEKPPLYKNYPPVAGSIAWARDLYQRAKRPILRFDMRLYVIEMCSCKCKYRYIYLCIVI